MTTNDDAMKLESQFNAWRATINDQFMFLQLTAAKPPLRIYVALVGARVNNTAVSQDNIEANTGMQTASAIPRATHVALQKFVAAAAHQGSLNITDIAKAINNNYQASHHRSCFVNDNVRLDDLADELHHLGAPEVLSQSMPIEALILQY